MGGVLVVPKSYFPGLGSYSDGAEAVEGTPEFSPRVLCHCRKVLTVLLFIARAFISGGFQAAYVYTPEVRKGTQ